ncbi:MAG: hypothetical protein ACREP1_07680 [Rhodanobacteraceae bacterium]
MPDADADFFCDPFGLFARVDDGLRPRSARTIASIAGCSVCALSCILPLRVESRNVNVALVAGALAVPVEETVMPPGD